jgi:hypothetical protein
MSRFDRFYVTNTIPTVMHALKNQPPFRILNIAPRLIEIITDKPSNDDESYSDIQETG